MTIRMLSLFAVLGFTAAAQAADWPCANGTYRSSDGVYVTLANPSAASGKTTQRFTFLDGRVGFLGEDDAPVCMDGTLQQTTPKAQIFERVPLKLTPTHFDSNGTDLAGLLIEPETADANTPLVVLVHGSENTGSINNIHYPYTFAGQGIAAFVFDKRGTGTSKGTYTQNFATLAADVVAAGNEAKRLTKGRYHRFGLYGGSQGGWVAPLAAQTLHPDFVAVGFGLVLSPLEEDAEQVFDELRRAGCGEDVIKAAHEVTDATGAIIASHFTAGFDTLAAVKARYGKEAWFTAIKGEFTGEILAATEADLRAHGPERLDNLDIIWRYDAVTELKKLTMPQLWVMAAEDTAAPGALSRDRLAALRKDGVPIEVVVFPHTDHGIYEFTTLPDGTRKTTRLAEGYLRLLTEWMKGISNPPYGDSAVMP
ncbi:hypothetical protein sos41_30860 [Alphaproteobacteria bacterium SO-S41]|nr:hypothetical protein sos41_30860 [Alphaproteobacteria bacterium SO-S41]